VQEQKKTFAWALSALVAMGLLGPKVSRGQAQESAWVPSSLGSPDSLLRSYSLEELQQYRAYYQAKIAELTRERLDLLAKGIADAEDFLAQHPESRVGDRVMMRLAEMHYKLAQEKFLAAMQQYDQDYARYEQGELPAPPPEPARDYHRPLQLYQALIERFPQSSLVDDAAYNIAFLTDELGNKAKAVELYSAFTQKFPDSRYVPDCLMRMADYYFNPPQNEITKAIDLYKRVLAYKDTPRYDEALYMLGWSYYRLSQYPEAISYFTALADDVERAKRLDPQNRFTNPTLREESVEYIAISFLDYGGPEAAADYITSIGGRSYGADILKKIGDVYMGEKEEYENAIHAYEVLLRLYPEVPIAPEVQAKIAECYRHLDDERLAYLSRDRLYSQYREGSAWWSKVTEPKAKERATVLAEAALRNNINLLLQRAEQTADKSLYLQAVNDSRAYIQSFPSDTSAPLIHWNLALTLDTKLKRYDEAYTEYIEISNRYWGSKYQKLAAENAIAVARDAAAGAIVVADTMLKQVQPPPATIGELKVKALARERKALTPAEQRLAEAYANYIRLFPHDSTTAVVLANAGALYYDHNQFPEALRYYNTLVKHFPNSPEVNYARYTILESYFGKLDFKSSEIVAKKILTAPSTPEMSLKAKRRLAESVFLSAEALADSNQHLAAAEEYRRVVAEVPDAAFGDLALFNGGLEFDKAKEYSRAVETYNLLIETYPKSNYLLDALNNLALDYGELGEFRNAALTYEKLASAQPDSNKARDALYNASVFFVRAQDWANAIRINRQYIAKYPRAEDADDLLYDVATYYLKLGDVENANGIYGEYVERFPDSPRVVETYFRRGEYFRERNRTHEATREYEKSLAKSNELKAKGLEANDYFAAEALFALTNLQYAEFDQIVFRLPQAEMEQSKKRKRELLLAVVDGYTRVAAYGTERLYQATYNIGQAYEEFAKTWAEQELPPMEETRRVVAQRDINATAAELYERAVTSYKNSIKVLTRLADNLRKTAVPPDTVAERGGRVAPEDTTLRVAERWIDKTKAKLSEVIYHIAELNYASMERLLQAPLPEGLDAVAELEYRNQVIGKAVKPLVDQIVATHVRNVQEADTLGLQNRWVDLSREKIVTTSNLIPERYHDLATMAQGTYAVTVKQYQALIDQGPSAAPGVRTTDLADQMANLIEFSKAFTKASMEYYKNTLSKAAAAGISNGKVEETKEAMIKGLVLTCQTWDSLGALAAELRKKYSGLFKETDDPRYEEALFTFQDNGLSIKEATKELLKHGYHLSQELAIANQWLDPLTWKLVKSAPDEYAGTLGLEIQSTELKTDSTWLASVVYTKGWTQVDFDDRAWGHAVVVSSETDPPGVWLMVVDTTARKPAAPDTAGLDTTRQDTIQQPAPEAKKIPAKRVFFRKAFTVEGLPVAGQIELSVDDEYNLFLNEEYLAGAAAASAAEMKSHDLSGALRSGKNVLAVEVTDTNGSGGLLRAKVSFRNLPKWPTAGGPAKGGSVLNR